MQNFNQTLFFLLTLNIIPHLKKFSARLIFLSSDEKLIEPDIKLLYVKPQNIKIVLTQTQRPF